MNATGGCETSKVLLASAEHQAMSTPVHPSCRCIVLSNGSVFFVFWHAPPGGIANGSNSKWRPCRPFKWSIVLPSPPRICWGIADCGQPIWGACGLSGHTDRRPSSRPARQRPQSMQALLPSCHRAQPVNHTPFIPKSSDPSQSHLCAAGTCGGNYLEP